MSHSSQPDVRMRDVSLAGLAIPVGFNTTIMWVPNRKISWNDPAKNVAESLGEVLLPWLIRGRIIFGCFHHFCYSNTWKCDRFNVISQAELTLSLRGFVGFWSLQALTHLHEKNVIYRVWEPGMFYASVASQWPPFSRFQLIFLLSWWICPSLPSLNLTFSHLKMDGW